MEVPDGPSASKCDNAYYAREFHSLRHHWQRSMSQEADLEQQVRLLRKEVAEKGKLLVDVMAEVGELKAEMAEMKETVAKAREYVKKREQKEVVA